tara:strand:+ start:400 stop:534 length:135 start_codon:yes stop_codon:yes gene_type:complete
MKEIDIKNHRDTIFPNILEGAYADERFFIEVFFEESFFTTNLII